MATVRCSTDKPIPHKCSSTAMVNTVSHVLMKELRFISVRRKQRQTRRTHTSSFVVRPTMYMPRICSSPECTIPVMRPLTTTGWKALPVGFLKDMMSLTTVVESRFLSTCPRSCRTSSSSFPISVTSCIGVTSCGTSPEDRMTFKDMVNWNMVTGLQVFRSLTICDWVTRVSCPTS